MNNEKAWLNSGNKYFYEHAPSINDKLPTAVYELEYRDGLNPGFLLNKISDNFRLPNKIYDLEVDLIKRVKHVFNNTDKSFGVLFKGLKGTGKTVTAKKISNDLGLPVILISSPFQGLGMASFVNSITQDVILFFDEFEKTFEFRSNYNEGSISDLLSLMDGVFTNDQKRLFLFTTNYETMPDSLIARPSRIRYVRDFSDISVDMIKEIFNDLVVNKELIPGLMKIVKNLRIITVDIVKALAEEANLFNTADSDFYKIFNITRIEVYYELNILASKPGSKKKQLISGAQIEDFSPGAPVMYEGYQFATIAEIDEVKGVLKLQDVDEDYYNKDSVVVTYKKSEESHRFFRFMD